jgi:hypothetical protein
MHNKLFIADNRFSGSRAAATWPTSTSCASNEAKTSSDKGRPHGGPIVARACRRCSTRYWNKHPRVSDRARSSATSAPDTARSEPAALRAARARRAARAPARHDDPLGRASVDYELSAGRIASSSRRGRVRRHAEQGRAAQSRRHPVDGERAASSRSCDRALADS